MGDIFFITGAGGFIGKRLLSHYLKDPIKIYLLSERRFLPKMQGFLDKEKMVGNMKAQVQLVEGDITRPGLGLGQNMMSQIKKETSHVLHLAAAYHLKLKEALGYRVNVSGTENVLRFIEGMPQLKAFGYLSTTAISGTHRGFFGEEDFDVGQKFKNNYEKTKYEAEKRVREKMKDIPTIIFRPTIVVGDSLTGEMEKIDGPYYGLVMISRKLHLVLQQAKEVRCHLVPVDFVAKAIVALMKKGEGVGRTIHLADPNPLSYDQFFDLVFSQWKTFKPLVRLPSQWMYPLFFIPGFEKLTGVPRQSFQYTMVPVTYGTNLATSLLDGLGIQCPSVRDYIGPMIHFFRNNFKKL